MRETAGRRVHRCCCPDCQRFPDSVTAKEHGALNAVLATLDERRRRLVAAFLANLRGRGGITQVAQITGLSRNTIRRGRQDLAEPGTALLARIRRPGGGRKHVEKKRSGDPGRP
jgi:DNA-binding phage protein